MRNGDLTLLFSWIMASAACTIAIYETRKKKGSLRPKTEWKQVRPLHQMRIADFSSEKKRGV